jgi:hypothetical protein
VEDYTANQNQEWQDYVDDLESEIVTLRRQLSAKWGRDGDDDTRNDRSAKRGCS